MKTATQILPGIKAIGWIDCRFLPRRVDLTAICGQTVAVLTDIHPIDFFGEPTCECATKKDGAGYEDTATLTFHTHSRLPRRDMGFVVTDANDRCFLIGSLEQPRPVIDCEHRLGSVTGGSAGYYYEIRHVALKTMVPCL